MYFEKALEMKPYLVEAMKNLSALCYNHQEFDKASRMFERFLRITLYDVYEKYDLNYSLKNLKLSKKLVDDMDPEYVYVLKNDIQSSSKIINEAALSLVKIGRFKEATGLLRNFLQLEDTSPELNYNLGQLYNISNKLDKALKYALRAVELKWDFKDAYDLIGNIYFKIHDYQKSIQSYKEVIALNSEDAMGYYNLGCVHHAAQDFDEAENCWKSAIKHEKGKKRIKDRDKISEDELSVSLIVFDRPISFRAHKSLGRLYLDRNSPDMALNEFEKAVELEPGDPEPYYELGKIYKAKSEEEEKYIEKAIFNYEKYLYFGGKKEEEVKKLLKTLKKK
jgi:tetratricopeptide (TPR) repeat protein